RRGSRIPHRIVRMSIDTKENCWMGSPARTSVALVLAIGFAAGPALAKKPLQPPCADRSFVIDGAPLLAGDRAGTPTQSIDLTDAGMALGSVCPAVRCRVTRSKKTTKVTAKWRRCAGIRGTATVTGSFDASCSTFRGTFVAKKAGVKKRAFTARVE